MSVTRGDSPKLKLRGSICVEVKLQAIGSILSFFHVFVKAFNYICGSIVLYLMSGPTFASQRVESVTKYKIFILLLPILLSSVSLFLSVSFSILLLFLLSSFFLPPCSPYGRISEQVTERACLRVSAYVSFPQLPSQIFVTLAILLCISGSGELL